MSETPREIVKNLSCRACTDPDFKRAHEPRPSRGHIVHPTLVPEFTPSEALKSGWRLRLFFHGRHEQTRVFSLTLVLGSVILVAKRSVFQLNRYDGDNEVAEGLRGSLVLGTAPNTNIAAQHCPPGIRVNEFLVFGDRDGTTSNVITIPVMHIISQYFSHTGE